MTLIALISAILIIFLTILRYVIPLAILFIGVILIVSLIKSRKKRR